jgi:hypothetical protein
LIFRINFTSKYSAGGVQNSLAEQKSYQDSGTRGSQATELGSDKKEAEHFLGEVDWNVRMEKDEEDPASMRDQVWN